MLCPQPPLTSTHPEPITHFIPTPDGHAPPFAYTHTQRGNTALIFAAEGGHTEVVQALLARAGIALHAVNEVGHVCTAKSSTTSHLLWGHGERLVEGLGLY